MPRGVRPHEGIPRRQHDPGAGRKNHLGAGGGPRHDPAGPVKTRPYIRYESMHYWANGERVMKAGNKKITAGSHMPTPTKSIWQVNSNSSLGNQKGHFDGVNNTLPDCGLGVYNDWWWTASCEYSDIVYGVDSGMEFKHPDLTAANPTPFVPLLP